MSTALRRRSIPAPGRFLALVGLGAAILGAAPALRAQDRPPRLTVEDAGTADAWVSYGDEPAFGFGLAPQGILTNLPPGDAIDPDLDFRDFADWAAQRGVTVARSYPPSWQVGPRWLDAFERAESDPDRFDLERFNEDYFARLREACELFREKGIFVHLQLWQAVTWKKRWESCYYHPDRNVNPDISRHAGPGAFVIEPERNPRLVAHQRAWVRRVLEATGDLGNVYYDVMNEIGNGTGVNARWLEAMLDEVEAWERERGRDLLVGLNDEGHDRPATGWSVSNPRLDIAFLDLGRYDEHTEARARHLRPTFGVRNIDWNPETHRRRYFATEDDLGINPDPELRSRSARMFWRMLVAGVPMNGGYTDWGARAYRAQPDCPGFLPTVPRVPALRRLAGPRTVEVAESPAARAYARGAPGCVIVLLEALPGTSGTDVPAGRVTLRLPGNVAAWAATEPLAVRAWDLAAQAADPFDPGALARAAAREVRLLEPASGEGSLGLEVPAFRDGLAICLSSPEDAAASDPPPPPPPADPPLVEWIAPEIVVIRTRTRQAFLWARGNTAPAGYEWERRQPGGTWRPVAETPTFYLNDDGLDPGRTYEYRTRALPPAGAPTDWSAATSVTPVRRNLLRDARHAFTRWPELRLAAAALLVAAAVLALWLRFRDRAAPG